MSQRSLLFLSQAEFKGENHGVYVQHAASLGWLLEAEGGWTVEALSFSDPRTERAAVESDVVVLHMAAHPAAEAIVRRRRAAGRPTVFEISDNFLDLGGWLPKRHWLRSPLVRQRILFHAWLCDAVQVYARPLATLFGTVNPRIGVFDPYVPLVRAPRASADGPFVLGWGGTTSHAEDLARIAPAIVDFCRRHDDVVFAFMGDNSLLDAHFTELPAEQVRARPFGAYEEYLDFVRTWNAGLAPLARGGFADARTDTKFGTYAACGVAALLERHPVYAAHADRALLFHSAEALTAKLEWLHEDRSRSVELGRCGHAWAARERSAMALTAQRTAFYDALLKDAPVRPGPVDPSSLEALRRNHRDWPSRIKYFRRLLEEQPFEYAALRTVIAHGEAHPEEGEDLDLLYWRLCLLAPEDVPERHRPAEIRAFLPA
jgi:hypothetical protein